MNDKTLRIEYVPIDSLHPDPANPRRTNADVEEALTNSLVGFGLVQPAIARLEDRVVISGHQRLIAARRLGMTSVPVTFLDVTRDQARLINLALNKISGTWDEALLARMIADLQVAPDVDITLSGFDDDEVTKLLKSLDARDRRERVETFDLEQALADAGKASARTKPGDVWLLGDHRLACADSTDGAAVARLLGGLRAQMASTDPPYNVDYGKHGGQQRGSRKRSIANDAMPPDQWEAFCRGWITHLVGNVDGAIYCFMSTKEWPLVSRLFQEAGAHWSDTLIWAKDRFVLGRADYQRQYEPIWYGWREGAQHHWRGDRDQGDVWTIPRPSVSDLHPHQKPIALLERVLENSSRPGDVVFDPFLGSGTTLIAAERTGRICKAIELDPAYVDVAVLRWEAFSGERAHKESA